VAVIKNSTFESLIEKVRQRGNWPDLLKTAAFTGWLTDEDRFGTRLSSEEWAAIRDLYNNTREARNAEIYNIETPELVGPFAYLVEIKGKTVQLTSAAGASVIVDAKLFKALRKRHPRANVYLWPVNTSRMPIIFSEGTTVAFLAPR
jgi:hypothetical protein